MNSRHERGLSRPKDTAILQKQRQGPGPTICTRRGGIELWFDAAFPKGSKILDVGAAAGRDVLLLLEAGYDAFGVDPCQELVAEGLRRDPVLKDRLACDALPGLETIGDHGFDGVLCSAVLMHLPEETLFDAAFGLRRVLKPGGRLLVSLPVDAGGEPVRGRDEKGRLFNGLSPDRLELMLTRLGFSCIGRGENYDSLGREERKWMVQLFVLKTDGAERESEIILLIPHSSRKIPPIAGRTSCFPIQSSNTNCSK